MKYLNDSADIKCPVCLNETGFLLYEVDSDQASQHFAKKEVDKIRHAHLKTKIENLWRNQKCKIVCCNKCNFVFAEPYTSGDAEFYKLSLPGITNYPKVKWEYNITREALKTILTSTSIKLLEIGAGNGAFIDLISDLIKVKDVTTTEYSLSGLKSMHNKGITALNTDVRNLNEKYANYFDVICMFQVLEHLDNLDVLFKKINEISKKNASLFIAVPNEDKIEFNEINGALLDMPPNHIGRWNKTAFNIFAQKYGWKIMGYTKEQFSLLKDLKLFVIYRYLQSSQMHNSIPNYIEQVKLKQLKMFFELAYIFFIMLTSLIPIIKMWNQNIGDSQWIHLVKDIPQSE